MAVVPITDPSLHGWLMGPAVMSDVMWLARRTATLLDPAQQQDPLWFLHHSEREQGHEDPGTLLESVYRSCPGNFAERVHEGLNIYWFFGTHALPPLLSLVRPLVQAELHLYSNLASGSPYRDHIVHMTRVSALAHLMLRCGSEEMRESASEDRGREHPCNSCENALLPHELRWDTIRLRWDSTYEFHLLRTYAIRRGLSLPDPAGLGDPWGRIVRSAALLAGLVHDVGYLHKAIGEVAEKAVLAVPWMTFVPDVRLPFDQAVTPLDTFYRDCLDVTKHGQAYGSIPDFLKQHYRNMHSVVGALWLAEIALRNRRYVHPGRMGTGCDMALRSEAELCYQLAAMMAFGHDLALSDKGDVKRLGLRRVKRFAERQAAGLPTGSADSDTIHVLNFNSFPLCTLFALSDVLQEFGRTLTAPEADALRQVVPMAGIGLETIPAGDKETEKMTIAYL